MNTETNTARPAMTDAEAAAEAAQIIANAYQPTAYRDPTPTPTIGTAPPVPQPGRPPMSQKATDASALMLSAGIASIPIGGMTSLVLYTLGHVDPAQLAIGGVVPVALILAIGKLLTRAKQVVEAAPAEHHHHYTGDVRQEYSHSETRSVWNKTVNK